MKKFKRTRKILALLLSLSLITGMMPATALSAFAATEEQAYDAAIIFSDAHTKKTDYKESTFKGIFETLKNTGLPFTSVTSAGDAFSVNEDNSSSNGPYEGYTSNITNSILTGLGDSSVPVNYVWSDHDRYAYQADGKTLLDKTSHLSYGAGQDGEYGTDDDANYYVYSLSMGDLCSYDRYNAGFSSNRAANGFTESVEKAIENFEADAEKLKKDRPLFIVSHQPLYDNRNDNAFAEQWFDAINEVATEMDVAFFYGHNHKYDVASDYYYAKGSQMPVATMDGWSDYEVGKGYKPSCDLKSVSKTLNFTHMCGGYLAPRSTGSTSNTTREGTVVVASIFGDHIQYTTYNNNGKYTGNYAVDESVKRDHAPSDTPDTPAVPEDTTVEVGNVKVVVSGATVNGSSAMSEADEALVDAKNYADVCACDIDATIPEGGGKAALKFTVPSEWQDKADRIVGFTVEDGVVEEITGTYEDGFYTFEVDHFSAKGIAVKAVEQDDTNTDTDTDSDAVANDFPDYPNPGSVELYKTAQPLDQNTGLTRVDLSTSGLPVNKGVDVIVMLDTSSSMDKCIVCNKYVAKYTTDKSKQCTCSNDKSKITTRVDELIESLKELESSLKSSPNPENIRIAIADFNGMYTDGPCATDNNDDTQDAGGLTDKGVTQVFTGSRSGYDMSAFITADTLDVEGKIKPLFTNTSAQTGTNYDYGFDVIYQLGNALKEENVKNGEERQLFVLFMSDGAPNQYNFYRSSGGNNGSTNWNYWLQGTAGVGNNPDLNTICDCDKHTYYYDDTNGNQHRMANAIKGSSTSQYNVIRKSDDGLENLLKGQNPTNNIYSVPGLDAKMYSIAFRVTADGTVTETSARKVLTEIASSEEMYVNAENATDLAKAFHDIGTEIAYAATNAVFTDIMGDDFKLQLGTLVNSNAATAVGGKQTVDTDIVVKTENVYIPSQVGTTVLGHEVTNADVGKPYGDATELERVEFNAEGTVATSNKLPDDDNILEDGIIHAKTFVYNTTPTTKTVVLEGDKEIRLGPDEFYWTIGTINQKRYTLSYVVYLTGSMEGTREAGSYKTNNLAKLSYTNWLGHDVSQTVPSPVVGWGKAQVSYAFYLVNEQGQPLYANGTVAPNFEKAYKVTRPVVYGTVNLNNNGAVISAEAKDILPEGYTLYDANAKYEVYPNSGEGKGSHWKITNGNGTTYVTGYAETNESSNKMEEDNDTYAYTDTTVYFAVKWSIKAMPDTVVIDFGLPVDISVLANDMFGGKGTLAGVGAANSVNADEHTTNLATGFGPSYANPKNTENLDPKYGTASINTANGKVRYTPENMEMNGYDQFAYAVKYTGTENSGYYYQTVTVIPATTIYYEDEFLTYTASNTVWEDAGNGIDDAVQDEDRPGEFSHTDADNVYGYDSVNQGMSTFSLGHAKKVHVNKDSYATAGFTFCGTGFDVVGMTSNTTGVITAEVIDERGTTVEAKVVNTYYGYTTEQHAIVYTYNEAKQEWIAEDKGSNLEGFATSKRPDTPKEGDTYNAIEQVWVPAPDAVDANANAIYQVPVLQVENLEYGKYSVILTATYADIFDKTSGEGYDLYIDAIRIYDPANDGITPADSDGKRDMTIENAYTADGEGWPSYIELRNKLIDPNGDLNITDGKFGNEDTSTKVEGVVFIDGDVSVGNAQISDYINYGPNNEVYLAPGQSVAFMLDAPTNLANLQIGIKCTNGDAATYTITNIAGPNTQTSTEPGTYYNDRTYSINTTTDMYYNLSSWKNDIIVITNTGGAEYGYGTTGCISLTNIKSTYKTNPNGQVTTDTSEPSKAVPTEPTETSIYMTPAAAMLTLKSLNTPVVPEQPDTPAVPDAPVTPEQPDTPTVPDKPEVDEPEVDKPVIDEPEPEKPVADPAKIISVKTDKKTYTQGDKVKVTVTTNSAATKVKVGTKTLKTFKTKNGNKTWTTTVKASKIGKLSIGTVAYNKEDTATKKVTKTVTVKKFAPKKFNVTLSKSKVKKGAKYTVTVKTSADVKYVKVNGKKITKFTTDKKKSTRTFKVTYKATKVGKKTVKVYAYNKAGYASKAKSKTVTVKKQ